MSNLYIVLSATLITLLAGLLYGSGFLSHLQAIIFSGIFGPILVFYPANLLPKFMRAKVSNTPTNEYQKVNNEEK